jgi:hypothetical protein
VDHFTLFNELSFVFSHYPKSLLLFLLNFSSRSHYKKSWFFKRFNLMKVSTLTKRMFISTKNRGHERHMVILVGVFY